MLPEKPSRASGTYVSPYRLQKQSPARNLSNNSTDRRLGYSSNPLNKYTPPSFRKTSLTNAKSRDSSPAVSGGSLKKHERSGSLRNKSPGLGGSPMGNSTGNRLYSPSGNIRGGSPTAYAAH